MNPGPAFDRVYVWLKDQLVTGALPPGSPLEPAPLAEALATSITPIRDALHRLAGERMVDAIWGEGFRVPSPTEAELRNLYAWNHSLLDLAVRAANPVRPILTADELTTIADISHAVARRGGTEHLAEMISVNERLGAARSVEPMLLGDPEREVGELRDLLLIGDDRGLRRAIGAYHRTRIRRVADLVEHMRRRQAS